MSGVLGQLRSLALENLNLKVLSVLLAVLIYLVVRRDTVREFTVPIQFGTANVPTGWVFVGDRPDEIRVDVRGRWSGIRELFANQGRRKFVADLRNYRDGTRFKLAKQDVKKQLGVPGVEVLEIRPSAIDVRLERLARRKVKVQVSTTGEPAEGFSVGPRGITVSPEIVEVEGPASLVKQVRRVRAAPIDLSGADSDLKVRSKLLGLAGKGLRLNVPEVEVAIKLDEGRLVRTLKGRPIVVRGCPDGIRCVLEPSEVNVTVKGLVRAVNAFVDQLPDNLVFADVGPAIARKERRIRLQTPAVEGLSLRVRPGVAKFRLLGEIPAN